MVALDLRAALERSFVLFFSALPQVTPLRTFKLEYDQNLQLFMSVHCLIFYWFHSNMTNTNTCWPCSGTVCMRMCFLLIICASAVQSRLKHFRKAFVARKTPAWPRIPDSSPPLCAQPLPSDRFYKHSQQWAAAGGAFDEAGLAMQAARKRRCE